MARDNKKLDLETEVKIFSNRANRLEQRVAKLDVDVKEGRSPTQLYMEVLQFCGDVRRSQLTSECQSELLTRGQAMLNQTQPPGARPSAKMKRLDKPVKRYKAEPTKRQRDPCSKDDTDKSRAARRIGNHVNSILGEVRKLAKKRDERLRRGWRSTHAITGQERALRQRLKALENEVCGLPEDEMTLRKIRDRIAECYRWLDNRATRDKPRISNPRSGAQQTAIPLNTSSRYETEHWNRLIENHEYGNPGTHRSTSVRTVSGGLPTLGKRR